MSPRRAGHDAARLLRWYPRGWRARHGQVLLGLLQDQADDQDRDTGRGLPARDAWSLRAHGAAERLTPGAGIVLALGGVLAAATGLALLMASLAAPAPPGAGAVVASTVLLTGVATSLTSLAALALVRDLTPTTAAATVVAAVASTAAWAAATIADLSWSVGFDQADADVPLSAFAAALPALLVAGVVLGTVALAPVAVTVLRGVPSRSGRRLLAVTAAALGAVALGYLALAPGASLLAAAGVLVGCALRRSSRRSRRPPLGQAPSRQGQALRSPGERSAAEHGAAGRPGRDGVTP